MNLYVTYIKYEAGYETATVERATCSKEVVKHNHRSIGAPGGGLREIKSKEGIETAIASFQRCEQFVTAVSAKRHVN